MHFGVASVEHVRPSPHGARGALQHVSPGAPQGGGGASTAASALASFANASAPVSADAASLPPSSCGMIVLSPTQPKRVQPATIHDTRRSMRSTLRPTCPCPHHEIGLKY